MERIDLFVGRFTPAAAHDRIVAWLEKKRRGEGASLAG